MRKRLRLIGPVGIATLVGWIVLKNAARVERIGGWEGVLYLVAAAALAWALWWMWEQGKVADAQREEYHQTKRGDTTYGGVVLREGTGYVLSERPPATRPGSGDDGPGRPV